MRMRRRDDSPPAMVSIFVDNALPSGLYNLLHSGTILQDLAIQYAQDEGTAFRYGGNSFWYQLARPPRLIVEYAILDLAKHLPTTVGISGVEWWVNRIDTLEGMGLHVDCDRSAPKDGRPLRCPQLASMLYFGESGPTVVLDQVFEPDAEKARAKPRAGFVYLPAPNRFAAFSGDRLHGVAIEERQPPSMRLTLLCNWWSTKPSEPVCVEVDYDRSEFTRIMLPKDASWSMKDECVRINPVRLTRSRLARIHFRDNRPLWTTTVLSGIGTARST